jgi:hypothetical protein
VSLYVKIGRYLDPFSVSVDVARHTDSAVGSFVAIDAVKLHNCAPGEETGVNVKRNKISL